MLNEIKQFATKMWDTITHNKTSIPKTNSITDAGKTAIDNLSSTDGGAIITGTGTRPPEEQATEKTHKAGQGIFSTLIQKFKDNISTKYGGNAVSNPYEKAPKSNERQILKSQKELSTIQQSTQKNIESGKAMANNYVSKYFESINVPDFLPKVLTAQAWRLLFFKCNGDNLVGNANQLSKLIHNLTKLKAETDDSDDKNKINQQIENAQSTLNQVVEELSQREWPAHKESAAFRSLNKVMLNARDTELLPAQTAQTNQKKDQSVNRMAQSRELKFLNRLMLWQELGEKLHPSEIGELQAAKQKLTEMEKKLEEHPETGYLNANGSVNKTSIEKSDLTESQVVVLKDYERAFEYLEAAEADLRARIPKVIPAYEKQVASLEKSLLANLAKVDPAKPNPKRDAKIAKDLNRLTQLSKELAVLGAEANRNKKLANGGLDNALFGAKTQISLITGNIKILINQLNTEKMPPDVKKTYNQLQAAHMNENLKALESVENTFLFNDTQKRNLALFKEKIIQGEAFNEQEYKDLVQLRMEITHEMNAVLQRGLQNVLDFLRTPNERKMDTFKQYLLNRDGTAQFTSEGIFRISGDETEKEQLTQEMNNADFISFDKKTNDHNVVAIMMKNFIRDSNIFENSQAYTALMSAAELLTSDSKNTENVNKHFRLAIANLPLEKQVILKEALKILEAYAKVSDKTKMTSSNLAIQLGPNLQPKDVTEDLKNGLTNAKLRQNAAEYLIENQKALFNPPKENRKRPQAVDLGNQNNWVDGVNI